jgi:hypothetical protein
MTNGEKIKILEKWKKCHDRAEEMHKPMEALFGRDFFGGEIVKRMWEHFDLTTELVALILGDKGGWCSWYATENGFGRKAMEAGPTGELRKIHNFNRLLWVIGATA